MIYAGEGYRAGGGWGGGERSEHRPLRKVWESESHVFALKLNQRLIDAQSQGDLQESF